ncbi:MAG: hypothetical protein RLZ81_2106, partial [Pseudomonadota bacterium]
MNKRHLLRTGVGTTLALLAASWAQAQ